MSDIPRRSLLTGAAASLLIVRPKTAFGTEANSAVSFGIIGTGWRGNYVGNIMTKDPRARIAGICDLYPVKIDAAKTEVAGADKVPSYTDYRKLLEQPGLDAVLIATPVYLHPVHFAAAVDAGKHIYCEKPAAADVAGVRAVLAAAKRADRSKSIVFGFQQRFSPEYKKALDYLKTGKIGTLGNMMAYWVLGGTPPATFETSVPEADRKNRHWDRWLALSGGPIVEQDCHGLDVMNWFAGDRHPVKAIGCGTLRYPVPYGDYRFDHHHVSFLYDERLQGDLVSIKHTAGYRSVREQFFGSAGMLETARTYYRLNGPAVTRPIKHADDLEDRSTIELVQSKREITVDAVEQFYTSIVENKPFRMAETAADSTLTALLGRMAVDKRREVTWEELLKSV